MNATRLRDWVSRPVLKFHERSPALFYGVMFVITAQIVSMFWDLRSLTQVMAKIVRR